MLLKVVLLGRTTHNLLGRHVAIDPVTIQAVVRQAGRAGTGPRRAHGRARGEIATIIADTP